MRSHSRGAIRPRFSSTSHPLETQRAQGRPGARCTRGLACNMCIRTRTRAYRFSGEHPAFPAQWFTAYSALSPATGFVATVIPEKRLLLRNLTPASGRQDHTTSPSAKTTLVSRGCRVHRIPPRVSPKKRGVAQRHETRLFLGETRGEKPLICPTAE